MDFTDGTAVTFNEERIVISSKTVICEAHNGSFHNVHDKQERYENLNA